MSLLIKNKSTINIINKMGPKIDPCGTPKRLFGKPLISESALIFCLLLYRQAEINDCDFLSKQKAFNFANSRL